MNKDLFSLKNIYRLLTDSEFAKPTYSVIPKGNLRGLTLVRFWSGVMLLDFRSGYYGKMIFRTEGPRNRFFSQVCNRDESITFYGEYAQELDGLLNGDVLMRQTEMMSSFLKVNEYSCEVLVNKVRFFMRTVSETDVAATAAVMEFLDKMLAESSAILTGDPERKAKYAGYILTCLQVLSLYGVQMEEQGRDRRIADIFGKNFVILMLPYMTAEKKEREVKVITNRSSTLWTQNSQTDRFYGRETELFDLNEAVETGGRYLISGHGGTGKTELMRRVLFETIDKNRADAVAVISYKDNIADSLATAFNWMSIVPDPGLAGSKIEIRSDAEPLDYANGIIAYLRSFDDRKLVIFIDDVDRSFAEDPLFEAFADLPATIFATSRLTRLTHFTLYKVDEPSVRDGLLIFRSIYGRRLSNAEKERMSEFLNDSKCCHTQTLVLLARLAKKNGWSVDNIIDKAESMSIRSLQDVYRRMYSLAGLSKEEKRLLTFIAWCPSGSMRTEFLVTYSPRSVDAEPDISSVRNLEEYGWILGNDKRIEMRPFVAECVRRMTSGSDAFAGFRERIADEWMPGVVDDDSLYEKIYELTVDTTEELLMKSDIMLTSYMEISDHAQLSDTDCLLVLIAGAIHVSSAAPLDVERLKVFRMICRAPGCSHTRYLISRIILMLSHDPEVCDSLSEDPVFKAEMSKRTVHERLVATYVSSASFILYERSELDKVYRLANWLLAHSLDVHMRARAYIYLAGYHLAHMHYEESSIQIEAGLRIADRMDEYCSLMLLRVSMNQMRHRFKEALRDLNKLKTYMSDESRAFRIDYEAEMLLSEGVLLRDMGEADRALKSIYKAVTLKRLYNGRESRDYMSALGDLANAYEKAAHYDESENCYLEVIAFFEKHEENQTYTVIFKNNLSVLYIKMNEPDKAIAVLDTLDIEQDPVGRHMMAEIYNNYSRAYALKGDAKCTVTFAELAYPILCEVYGRSDIKCIENRERYALYSGKKP